jgi:hypothetical protein
MNIQTTDGKKTEQPVQTKSLINDKIDSIRHEIKNQLNLLTLAEYMYYGNNDRMKQILSTMDKLLTYESIINP